MAAKPPRPKARGSAASPSWPRWRGGLTVVSVLTGSFSWVRLPRPRSFLRTGLPAALYSPLNRAPNPRSGIPRSGYRVSDFVLWHEAGLSGAAASQSVYWGSRRPDQHHRYDAVRDRCWRL